MENRNWKREIFVREPYPIIPLGRNSPITWKRKLGRNYPNRKKYWVATNPFCHVFDRNSPTPVYCPCSIDIWMIIYRYDFDDLLRRDCRGWPPSMALIWANLRRCYRLTLKTPSFQFLSTRRELIFQPPFFLIGPFIFHEKNLQKSKNNFSVEWKSSLRVSSTQNLSKRCSWMATYAITSQIDATLGGPPGP